MTRLEQEVTHSDHTSYVLWVDLKALLQIVCSLLQVLELEINNTDLSISLVVLIIILHNKFVVFERLMGQIVLMQDFTKTKVRWDTCGVELDAMFEILFGFGHFA